MLVLQTAVGDVLDAWLPPQPHLFQTMYTLPVVWLDNTLLLAAAPTFLQRSVCCAGYQYMEQLN